MQGYTYSVFNLVYETNVASCRIWDALGFKRIGRIKGAGNLKSYPNQPIDAIMYGRELGTEGEDCLSEERFDKIKFYLKHGKYPNGADRAEKSRLRSAATHYKLLEDDRLMLKDKEVISDAQQQYEIARAVHVQQHAGINKTTGVIAEKYHWVRIKETVSLVIRNCNECKESTAKTSTTTANGGINAGTSGTSYGKKVGGTGFQGTGSTAGRGVVSPRPKSHRDMGLGDGLVKEVGEGKSRSTVSHLQATQQQEQQHASKLHLSNGTPSEMMIQPRQLAPSQLRPRGQDVQPQQLPAHQTTPTTTTAQPRHMHISMPLQHPQDIHNFPSSMPMTTTNMNINIHLNMNMDIDLNPLTGFGGIPLDPRMIALEDIRHDHHHPPHAHHLTGYQHQHSQVGHVDHNPGGVDTTAHFTSHDQHGGRGHDHGRIEDEDEITHTDYQALLESDSPSPPTGPPPPHPPHPPHPHPRAAPPHPPHPHPRAAPPHPPHPHPRAAPPPLYHPLSFCKIPSSHHHLPSAANVPSMTSTYDVMVSPSSFDQTGVNVATDNGDSDNSNGVRDRDGGIRGGGVNGNSSGDNGSSKDPSNEYRR